jgi:hypothetical protein
MNGICFLLDEDVPEYLADELVRLEPTLDICHVGIDPAPQKGTPDPELLLFAEKEGRTFVTRDKRTMPGHLADHHRAGHHTWGVFMLIPGHPTIKYAEDLVLIWSSCEPINLVDWSDYLPW